MNEITVNDIKEYLSSFTDHFGYHEVSVTMWHNGEGFTIYLSSCGNEHHLTVTWNEWKLIKKIITKITKGN